MKKLVLALSFLFFFTLQADLLKASEIKVLLETSFGNITIELYPDKAPVTVKNFVKYVKSGFYNNTIFHRVIKNFMIQGGGFSLGMKEKESSGTIINEADNGLKNKIYTIAMARTSEPHSASSQFFINTKRNYALDFNSKTDNGWGYCVFGKVVKGENIVKKIENQDTSYKGMYRDVPVFSIVIRKATLLN